MRQNTQNGTYITIRINFVWCEAAWIGSWLASLRDALEDGKHRLS